jgi:hypothetical protein
MQTYNKIIVEKNRNDYSGFWRLKNISKKTLEPKDIAVLIISLVYLPRME